MISQATSSCKIFKACMYNFMLAIWVSTGYMQRVIPTYLLNGNTSRKKLDQIASIQNRSRIPWLSCCLDGHATLDQVKSACDAILLQSSCDNWPRLLQVDFAILGEQADERRLLCKCATNIVLRLELFNLCMQVRKTVITVQIETRIPTNLPVINVIRIPRLVLLICRGHFEYVNLSVSHKINSKKLLKGSFFSVFLQFALHFFGVWAPSTFDDEKIICRREFAARVTRLSRVDKIRLSFGCPVLISVV